MTHVINDLCLACGSCIDECPSGAIKAGEEIYTIDPELCTDCGLCVDNCPTDAIEAAEKK
jgi:Indolepyruvate ferredoxin oxidoreductase, alpha and beta subunits